ncbi:macrophage mannose receptor 1-like [Ostrinia furnacalis]|uniref:macrophage mannose receptor 1-like n=1 Tax=Ostrinia furnacalis TaxID=93504 RepID=UPI00103F870B|nr:macrophage mannose receptor 1-like [Ostrinia furnacalis]
MFGVVANMLVRIFFIAIFTYTANGSKLPDSGEPADKSTFRLDYQYYPQADGWLKLHRIPARFRDARLACYHEGAHLASPITEDLAMVLSNLAQEAKLSSIHTGFYSLASVQDYYSGEGVKFNDLSFLKWADGEPNNVGNSERCLSMTSLGTMADSNEDTVRPFFCYKKKTGYTTMNECGYHDKQYQVDDNTGHCYKFHLQKAAWHKALSICGAEGGTLAVINSGAEAKVINDLAVQKNYSEWVLLGFYNPFDQPGYWWTVDGHTSLEEAGYANWLKGEPNDLYGPEYCGTFRPIPEAGAFPGLNDFSCNIEIPFVCEIPPLNKELKKE